MTAFILFCIAALASWNMQQALSIRKARRLLERSFAALDKRQLKIEETHLAFAEHVLNPPRLEDGSLAPIKPEAIVKTEVHEVLRSRPKPWEHAEWEKIVRYAEHGYSLDIKPTDRRQVIRAVHTALLQLDAIAVAARLYLDTPPGVSGDPLGKKLHALLEAAGLFGSRTRRE